LNQLIKCLENIDWKEANHYGVYKKVIFSGEEFVSKITQIAYTELVKDNIISIHQHETMEEVFFILDGICEFTINNEKVLAEEKSTIRIPPNTEHSLHAITDCQLFYFGVSI
jgi:mannose-6-phosphate isomerase-like protein (cupin superfamily)